MDNVCQFCNARFWLHEDSSCCNKGDIHFQTEFDVGAELRDLLTNTHFKDHIRQYNTAMAMASVGHDARQLPGGPSSIILSGNTFHRISGGLLADQGWNPSFAQIYLLDTHDACNLRMDHQHQALRPDILNTLHAVMMAQNPWVRQFCSAALNVHPLRWRWDGDDVNDAMVIGAMIARPGDNRNIVIQVHDAAPRLIHDCHQLYHPLAYPLLFPSGQTGWHLGFSSVSGVKVTRAQYLKYLLMRRSSLSHMQQCGRLTLEFYCDAWASHEASIMEFHRRPQQQAVYRTASRAALIDQLVHGEPQDIGVPVRTVLPASVVGSPRFYHTLFLNAMALPRRFGKPDLFITMTANPHWEEIRDNIPRHSEWQFHPDIVARVFMLKVDSLIADIRERKIFGDVAAIVWRIEWQKRGLPHLHMLVILKQHINTCADIDSFVSAEIPDPDTDPILHALVAQCNVHKPCDTCGSASCVRNGKCHRDFPKIMAARTTILGSKFPVYKRRGLHVCEVKDYNGVMRTVTDEWVVPYSPFLTRKYACHLNVEVRFVSSRAHSVLRPRVRLILPLLLCHFCM